ncbi:hypothetical protein SK128_007988, partial [Halocaridina rubra]
VSYEEFSPLRSYSLASVTSVPCYGADGCPGGGLGGLGHVGGGVGPGPLVGGSSLGHNNSLGSAGLGHGSALGGPLAGGIGTGGHIGGGVDHGGAIGGPLFGNSVLGIGGAPIGGGIIGSGGLGHAGIAPLGPVGTGVSATCRYWCRTPERQAYCCEGNDELEALPSVKPGQCPPVRPQCPPVRAYGAPTTCSNDSKCPGKEKCCFDRCLEHNMCKLTIGYW